ncbi:MAG: hypothetical protein INR73_19080 [Williamsia sp.]|nr:hypothetical protein [Williamsia sp.]
MKDNDFLHSIPLDEFLAKIKSTVISSVEEVLKNSSKSEYPELFTPAQVAAYFRVTKQTVNNWSKDGVLNKIYVGGKPYYKRDEILSFTKEKISKKLIGNDKPKYYS